MFFHTSFHFCPIFICSWFWNIDTILSDFEDKNERMKWGNCKSINNLMSIQEILKQKAVIRYAELDQQFWLIAATR